MNTKINLAQKGKTYLFPRGWVFSLLLMVGILLAACSPKSTQTVKPKPAQVEAIGETGLKRVVLTEKAAERIGIQTIMVDEMQQSKIPLSAVIYDVDGKTWVYTNPEQLTFVRQRISVERVDGAQALLLEKLPGGSNIVTVGVMELYGAETGVGK